MATSMFESEWSFWRNFSPFFFWSFRFTATELEKGL